MKMNNPNVSITELQSSLVKYERRIDALQNELRNVKRINGKLEENLIEETDQFEFLTTEHARLKDTDSKLEKEIDFKLKNISIFHNTIKTAYNSSKDDEEITENLFREYQKLQLEYSHEIEEATVQLEVKLKEYLRINSDNEYKENYHKEIKELNAEYMELSSQNQEKINEMHQKYGELNEKITNQRNSLNIMECQYDELTRLISERNDLLSSSISDHSVLVKECGISTKESIEFETLLDNSREVHLNNLNLLNALDRKKEDLKNSICANCGEDIYSTTMGGICTAKEKYNELFLGLEAS